MGVSWIFFFLDNPSWPTTTGPFVGSLALLSVGRCIAWWAIGTLVAHLFFS